LETKRRAAQERLVLRLALVALAEALSPADPERCAAAFDTAARMASEASRNMLETIHANPGEMVGLRFEAARVINSLCGACGECPRGRGVTPSAGRHTSHRPDPDC
jgi:hypothetical protein